MLLRASLLLVASAVLLRGQNIAPPKPPEPATPRPAATPSSSTDQKPVGSGAGPTGRPNSDKEEVPPEEDASLAIDSFRFNPLQSRSDVEVGNGYYKKGNLRAAANRYAAATKRDDSNGEAWLRLGEASLRLQDPEAAKQALQRYLELAPAAKNAPAIRKLLHKLK